VLLFHVEHVSRERGKPLPAYTLGQAARACGRSKSALSRDVKAGKLSAIRNDDGSLAIEASELFRVYEPVSHGNRPSNGKWDESQPRTALAGTGFEHREIVLLRERMAADAETIRDLRHRLDREAEERRQLIAILTDQRRRPWWRRWLR
jgi:hypothetical protein